VIFSIVKYYSLKRDFLLAITAAQARRNRISRMAKSVSRAALFFFLAVKGANTENFFSPWRGKSPSAREFRKLKFLTPMISVLSEKLKRSPDVHIKTPSPPDPERGPSGF